MEKIENTDIQSINKKIDYDKAISKNTGTFKIGCGKFWNCTRKPTSIVYPVSNK